MAEDIKAGDVFAEDNLRVVRPGYGLPPKYIDMFLGKKAGRDLNKGTPLSWEHLG